MNVGRVFIARRVGLLALGFYSRCVNEGKFFRRSRCVYDCV